MSIEDPDFPQGGGASGGGYLQCLSCGGAGRVPTKYHDILDIPLGASPEEVTRAFRRKAMQHHPDRNKAPDATARMQAVSEARSLLLGSESIRAGTECSLCGGRGTTYAGQPQGQGARAEQPSGGGAGSSPPDSGAGKPAGSGGGGSSRKRGIAWLFVTLFVGVAALAYFADAPTEEPTDVYERVTQELLPGMRWGELEPGLEGYVRAMTAPELREGNERNIARGNQQAWVGRFIDEAAAARGEALVTLGIETIIGRDDNLYLRWRKIEDRSTGARNTLFEQLADLRESPADTPFEELTPMEQALDLWHLVLRNGDDEEREHYIGLWNKRYLGTEEGDYVLRNTNQAMRMPLVLNNRLGKTAQMQAIRASAEAMERHILEETGDPAAAKRYRDWFWMVQEVKAETRRALDREEIGVGPLEQRGAAPTPTTTPTPTLMPTPTPPFIPLFGPWQCQEVRRREGPQSEAYYLCYRDWLERERARATPVPMSRPTATPVPTSRPTATPWPTPRPVTPTPTPTPTLYDFRRNAHGAPEMWNGEQWIRWEDIRPCWELHWLPSLRVSVIWSRVDCDARLALPVAATPAIRPFVERDGQCYAEPPYPPRGIAVSGKSAGDFWVRIDCPSRPTPTPRLTATPTPIPCPSTGYGAMSCVRAWPAGVPVRAAVECWIDAECGGFEHYDYITKLDAGEPVLYWTAPDLARRNPVVVAQLDRALKRMAPLLGVEFEETESRTAARLVIRMEEDRECNSEQAGACGGARLAHRLTGASGRDGWEIGLSEVMIRTRYTRGASAYRILIHEMAHALTGMGHSYRCGSLMRDWEDDGFIRGCVAAGYPRYHMEFSSMDEAVLLINSHPAVAAGTRRADWRDFICGRDC